MTAWRSGASRVLLSGKVFKEALRVAARSQGDFVVRWSWMSIDFRVTSRLLKCPGKVLLQLLSQA